VIVEGDASVAGISGHIDDLFDNKKEIFLFTTVEAAYGITYDVITQIIESLLDSFTKFQLACSFENGIRL
jgi:hypothetical protein